VLVLAPTNTGKLGNRWQGPGTVVCVKSPRSYLVELDRGQIRHIHANKMRGFVVRVQCCSVSDLDNEQVLSLVCGVINDADVDFDEIVVLDSVSVVSSLPSVRVDPTKLDTFI